MLSVSASNDCAICQKTATDQFAPKGFDVECFSQDVRWLRNAWQQFHSSQSGVDPNCMTCLQVEGLGGSPIGGSSWFKQFKHGISWWQMIGSGSICSDYVQLPCIAGVETQVAVATANWFANQPRKSFGVPTAIEVDGHRSNCKQWQAFFDTLVSQGWSCDSEQLESAWRVQLPDTWKEYEATLSQSRRRKARRALKMLDRGELDYQLMTTPEEVDQHWADFVYLHQLRRQQMGQPGCFADPKFEAFLRSAAQEFAADDSAFIARLCHSGKPLATLLVFRTATTWFIYQSGLDSERVELEPGHLVNALTLQRAIESGVQYLDYMRGDEHYKSGWRSVPNSLSRTVLFPPGLASRGISSALKIKRNLKAWLKSGPSTSSRSQQQTEE